MNMPGFNRITLSLLVAGVVASSARGGPVIIGGEDLDFHGSNSGGTNHKGWLYIQKALTTMYRPNCITRDNDGSIAALGCPSTSANVTSADAAGAIHYASAPLGKTVNYYEGATAVNSFFTALNSGSAHPAIIYISSSFAANGVTAGEGAAITAHAADLKAFVNSGGGLMAHVDGANTSGWVTAVTGVTVNTSGANCNSVGSTLTAAGNTSFPGLANSDIDSSAGPCHATFSGNLGGLQVLALDGHSPKRNFILGGDCQSQISTPTPTPTPTATPKTTATATATATPKPSATATATPSAPPDPCCPPWHKTALASMLIPVSSGSINSPYTVHFQATASFDSQMLAYINYLYALNPLMNKITIDWRLHDQGTGPCTNCKPPYGPQVGPTVYTTWTQGATGNGVFSNPGFFNLPTSFPMVVGRCYLIHTGIYLENGQHYFPKSCNNTEVCIYVQVISGPKRTANIEIRSGTEVIRRIPFEEVQKQ